MRHARIRAAVLLLCAGGWLGIGVGTGCGATAKHRATMPTTSASVSASSVEAAPERSPSQCPDTDEPATSPAEPIARVDVQGNLHTPVARYCAALGTRAGMAFDGDRIGRDIRSLWSTGLVDDVSVSSEDIFGGRAITFFVHERPLVRAWSLHGVSPSDPARVRTLLGPEGKSFDPGELHQKMALLRAQYSTLGFRSADLRFSVEPAASNQVDVKLEVVEGVRATIREIRLKGVSKGNESDLRALVETDGGRVNTVGRVFSDELFEASIVRIDSYYYDRGMIEAEAPKPTLIEAEHGASLTVVLELSEGAIYHISGVSCTGDLADTEKKCLELLGVKKNDLFRRSEIMAGVERVKAFQESHQHGAVIEPQTSVDAKKHTVFLTLPIRK